MGGRGKRGVAAEHANAKKGGEKEKRKPLNREGKNAPFSIRGGGFRPDGRRGRK